MISYKRPQASAAYLSDASITTEKEQIQNKILSDYYSLKSTDFKDIWKKYRRDFADAQGQSKCGYCEARITPTTKGTLDHYRPKTEITKLRDPGKRINPPNRRDRNKKFHSPSKPGYWWLAYNWDNWILSCGMCNSSWKMNQFPIASSIVNEHGDLLEVPLILNPFEINDAHKQFNYTLTGDISGLTEAAINTVTACGLDRWDLVDDRLRLIQQFLTYVQEYKIAREKNYEKIIKITLDRIARMCDSDSTYAGMIRQLVDNNNFFDDFNSSEIIYMRDGGAFAI